MTGMCQLGQVQALKPQLSSHVLESLRCSTSDTYFIQEDEEENTGVPFSCSFSKASSLSYILGVVDENGYVILYNTNKTGDEGLITDWQAHNNAVFDLAWLEREEKLLTASGDQTVVLWDVRCNKKLDTFKGHTGTVRSVSLHKQDNAVFATGSRDGNILVWDSRCNRKDKFTSAVNTIRNAHILPSQFAVHQPTSSSARKRRRTKLAPALQDSQHGVTAVTFQNDHLLASAGAVDGCIKMWDIRKIYKDKPEPAPVYQFPYTGTSKRKRGFSHMCFDSTYTRLFASCTDDIIYMYDLAAYNPTPVSCIFSAIHYAIKVKVTTRDNMENLWAFVQKRLPVLRQQVPPQRFPPPFYSDIPQVVWVPKKEDAYCAWAYDIRNRLVCHFKGHKNDTFYVKTALSPDDQFLLSGSSDELAYIWQVGKPSQSPVVLKGHRSEVTGVAWSEYDAFRLATLSDDNTIRIWRYDPSITEEQAMDIRVVSGIAETTHRSIGTSANSDLENMVPVSPYVDVCPRTPQLSKIKPIGSSRSNTPKVCDKQVHREIVSKVQGEVTSNSSSPSIRGWLLRTQAEMMPETKNAILIKNTSTESSDAILDPENPDLENIEPKRKHSCKRKFVHEEESPRKRQCILASLDSEINSSPEKSPNGKKRDFSSPIHISKFHIHTKTVSSPTANLPNLVFDPKPLKGVKEDDCDQKPKGNWLTHLSRQKRGLTEETKTSLLQGPNHVLESPQSQALTSTISTLSSSDVSSQESLSRSEISSPRAKIKSPPKGTRPLTHFFQRHARLT